MPCRAMGSCSLAAGRSGIRYEIQMRHGSGGCCGCLWPPASFPSSQAKSRACYQEQKMCHLCCISFPFLHLFPARCASKITAFCTEAGVQGRQRPRQPYRCLAGRKEIRKFAEIFDQQNKQFSCQAPNRQLGEPAAICMAPLAASFWSTVPTEPPRWHRAHPVPGALSAGAPRLECAERRCGWQIWGTGTPVQLSPVANRHSTMGAAPRVHPKPCPRARPRRVPDLQGGCQDWAAGQGAAAKAWCRWGEGCARGSEAEGQYCSFGANKRR